MPVLPLGLACVAAAVEGAGHDVQLLNLMMQTDTQQALKEAIAGFDPEIIGISVRNIDDQKSENSRFLLADVKDFVRSCREFSGATIVLGGAGYSIFPQASLDFLEADIGIQGEGESAFLKLLERLGENEGLSEIPGLFLAGQDPPSEREYIKSLADVPLPLPDIHLSTPSALKNQEIWIPFQTRRGCPLDCTYCSTATIEGRTIRKHDPQKVVDIMSKYAEAGFDHFFFVDNTFNLPNSYALRLCEKLIAAEQDMTWRCLIYPWKVGNNLAEKMAAAGCKEVSLGFESGSAKVLARLNKKFNTDEVRQISNLLKDNGIRRMGFLLLGGPGETKETVNESLEFADSLNLEAVKITIGIRIYPYTPLAKIALKEGLIKADDNLLFPRFYISKDLEGWLRETVNAWRESRPHWIM